MKNGIEDVIKLLRNNQPFLIGDLRLEMINGMLNVTGWSQYGDLRNVTREIALRELSEIKLLYNKMLQVLFELHEFVEGIKVQFNLWFDDSGRASTTICSEINGSIHWYVQ